MTTTVKISCENAVDGKCALIRETGSGVTHALFPGEERMLSLHDSNQLEIREVDMPAGEAVESGDPVPRETAGVHGSD